MSSKGMLHQVSCSRSSQHNNHDRPCLDMLCSQICLCKSSAALPHCVVQVPLLIVQTEHSTSFTPLVMDPTALHHRGASSAIICCIQDHGQQRRLP